MTEEFEVKIGRVSLEGFSTAELVEELSKRDGVEVYDVEGDVYLQRDGGGYKVRLYKSKRLVVRENDNG